MTLGKTRRKSGFSLMEFLIVIGIIAVLAVIIVPATVGIINKSNQENDKVLAATYTEYMQKFATEKVGSADFYSTVYNDGVGSEYDILESNSGLGSFPGITQLNEKINSSNEEDVWKAIRKEACIAIKAYGEVELADNDKYFIEKPIDEEMAFIYYYLTGKVEIKNVSDMKKITIQEVNDGAIDTEDYWVYLDREGGSGKAIGQPNTQRDFYVQIYQYGVENGGLFNEPINGVKVSLNFKDKTGKDCTKSAITSTQGLLVFRDVPSTVTITAEREGAISYPDSTYYPVSETGPWYADRRLPDEEYWRNNVVNTNTVGVGNSASNPFVIYLKMGTLGSLEFLETVKTYQYTPGSGLTYKTDKVQIINPNDFTTSFSKTDDSIRGRDETYESSTPGYNPLELLGVDESGIFRFLMYGDYNMNITNTTINTAIKSNTKTNFLPYKETITSDVFGIYNRDNPGDYPLNSSPYPYPVTLTRTDTYIRGTLVAEKDGQPLHGSYENMLLTSENGSASILGNVSITTRVYAVNSKNDYYYSDPLTSTTKDENGRYIYNYDLYLKGQNDGSKKYQIFLVSEYGRADGTILATTVKRMDMVQWPDEITADGSTYVFNTSTKNYTEIVLQSDVATANPKITIYEENENYANNKKFVSYTATLERKGYSGNELVNNLTKYTITSNHKNGVAQFSNVKKGFYTLKIDYINEYEDVTYDVFIDEGDYVIKTIRIPPQFPLSFVVTPYHANATTKFTGKKGILDTKTYNGETSDGIAFDIYIDDQIFNGPQTINRTYGNDGEVTVSILCTGVGNNVKIVPKIDCFIVNGGVDMSDLRSDGLKGHKITMVISSAKNDEFKVLRCENIANSTKEHANGFWKWTASNTEHYQLCQRCGLERLREDHHYEAQLNGSTSKYVTPSYFAVSAATTSNNSAKTETGHYAHCKVCNIKDIKEKCSGGSWTYYYEKFSGSKASHTGHGTSSYPLSNSGSDAKTGHEGYHYKYCSSCGQRYASQKHSDVWSATNQPGHCSGQKKFIEYDCICEYYYKDEGPVPDHTYNTTFYYGREYGDASRTDLNSTAGSVPDNCLYKITSKYCTVCQHNPGKSAEVYYASVQDVPMKSNGSYGSSWAHRYFDRWAHLNDKSKAAGDGGTHSQKCIPAKQNGSTATSWMTCEEGTWSFTNVNSSYSAAVGERGIMYSGNYKSGLYQYGGTGAFTRYDGLLNRKIFEYEADKKGNWVCYTATSACDVRGTLFKASSETASITLSGNFTQGAESYDDDAGGTCSMCCRRLWWPNDATDTSNSEHNNHAGSWYSCFNTIYAYSVRAVN